MSSMSLLDNSTLQTIIPILQKPSDHRSDAETKALVPLIQNIQFFQDKKIKPKDLVEICSRLRYEHHPKGKNVIEIGEVGDKFYIILQG